MPPATSHLVVGGPGVRAIVVDPERDRAYRLEANGDVEADALRDGRYQSTIAHVAGAGGAIAIDRRNGMLYGQDAGERVVTRWSFRRDAWMTPVQVGLGARDALAVGGGGRYVFCGDARSRDVAVVDIGRNALTSWVPLPGAARAIATAGTPSVAFVAVAAPELVIVDPAAPDPSGWEPHRAAIAGTVRLTSPATALAATNDGKLVVALEASGDRLEIVAADYRVALGSVAVRAPRTLALTDDGKRAYVALADGTVAIVELAGFRIVGRARERVHGPFAVASW